MRKKVFIQMARNEIPLGGIKLLIADPMLPEKLRDNLERLAGDLLLPHDKAPSMVDGKALLEVINYLGESKKKAIQYYYGLMSPNYEPLTLAKAGKVLGISGSAVAVNRNRGFQELLNTSYLTAYHQKYRNYAIMAMQEPHNHVPVSLLAGRDCVNPGFLLKCFGIFSIQQLADITDQTLDSLEERLQTLHEGRPDLYIYRPCELSNHRAKILCLRDQANSYLPMDQVVNKSIVRYQLSDDGPTFYAWEVEHLVQLLSTNLRNTLLRARVYTMVDFMSLTMDGLFRMRGIGDDSIDEICYVRKKLGFPVEDSSTK